MRRVWRRVTGLGVTRSVTSCDCTKPHILWRSVQTWRTCAMIAQNILFCERVSCGFRRVICASIAFFWTRSGVSFPSRRRAGASCGAVPLIWRWQACANWRQSRRLAGARRRHILTYSTSISLLSFSILISFISFDFRILHNFSIGISNNTDSL